MKSLRMAWAGLIGIVMMMGGQRTATAEVLITNSTAIGMFDTSYEDLDLVVSNATLTVDGPHRFGNLLVLSGGIVTHSPLPTGALTNQSKASNGINLTLSGRLEVSVGGSVLASGRGYSGGNGPGKGSQITNYNGAGGGHGGLGGNSLNNAAGGAGYGSFDQPVTLGSGGGAGPVGLGGAGGGNIRLQVAGTAEIQGQILAKGTAATNSRSGGGSGGTIWIQAQTLTGNGQLSVQGGSGEPVQGGGGGGGRLALEALTNTFTGSLSASGGDGSTWGGPGTIYNVITGQSTNLLLTGSGQPSAYTLLSVSNRADVTIRNGAWALVTSPQVLGNLRIEADSGLCSTSRGVVASITVTGSALIESNAAILMDRLAAQGGNSSYAGGGGGNGGDGAPSSSGSFGDASTPHIRIMTNPLSWTQGDVNGGSFSVTAGGAGGGRLYFSVSNLLVMNGKISANGGNGDYASSQYGGGGAGGSMEIYAASLEGTGEIHADGGSGASSITGAGGGGRIAINVTTNLFAGKITAHGGPSGYRGKAGGAGTVFITATQPPTSKLWVDNGGFSGVNTPLVLPGTNDVEILGGGKGTPGNAVLVISNLTIRSDASLWTSMTNTTFGGSRSRSAVTVLKDAFVEVGGAISADGIGENPQTGLGAGKSYGSTELVYSGAGYGGNGGQVGTSSYGNGSVYGNFGGFAYGNMYTPTNDGSGGGNFSGGGQGGGAVKLVVNGHLTLEGQVSAEGGDALGIGGGGAGGSVWIQAGTISGHGLISARGGRGNGTSGKAGSGGGGRVAVESTNHFFAGRITAQGGEGTYPEYAGGAGTVYLRSLTAAYGQLILDNEDQPAGITPLAVPFSFTPRLTNDLVLRGRAQAAMITNVLLRHMLIQSNSWVVSTNSNVQTINAFGDVLIESGGGIHFDGVQMRANPIAAGYSLLGGTSGGGGGGGYGGDCPHGPGGKNAFASFINADVAGGNGGYSTDTYVVNPYGGLGGGALNLNVGGTLTAHGVITAHGTPGQIGGGGGAGGGIKITVGTLTGNGLIAANGGEGNILSNDSGGGGGGGGQIALYYGTNQFAGAIEAYGGPGWQAGGAGTLYFKDKAVPGGTLRIVNRGLSDQLTPLSGTPAQPYDLFVAEGGTAYRPTTSTPLVLANLTLESGGRLAFGKMTVNVVSNATIAAGATFSVDGIGSSLGIGTGAGKSLSSQGSGGGHGGIGGASASGAVGGVVHGSNALPDTFGSGGGSGSGTEPSVGYPGSSGGGAIRLTVGNRLEVDGRMSADGNPGLQDNSGGGAGGSIWVTAKEFAGSGVISARGGDGDLYGGGGGGGGRIALYTVTNLFTGLVTTAGGAGANPGQEGTTYQPLVTPGFQIYSHTPAGTVSNQVSAVDLFASEMVDTISAFRTNFVFQTPEGVMASSLYTVSFPAPSTIRVAFSTQHRPGNYQLLAKSRVADMFGETLPQDYEANFTMDIPAISGAVTNEQGKGISGVTLQPDGGLPSTKTDTNGNYVLGVPPGWSGTVTPSLSSNLFLPATLPLTNVTVALPQQNFLVLTSAIPRLRPDLTRGLNWTGLSGRSYQVLLSSNLVQWEPWGEAIVGTNGPISLPLTNYPAQFFRLQVTLLP